MSIISALKSNKIHMPIWLGQFIARMPYSMRPIVGTAYKNSISDIIAYNKMDDAARKEYIFKKMYFIVKYALENIDFYNDFYHKNGFDLSKLKSFEDIDRIPIISKDDLLNYPIEQRTNMHVKKYIQNTGGSSGHTFTLYIQPQQVGVEWAHIHTMWALLGFVPTNLRIFMSGRSKVKGGAVYDFARHVLSLDIYKSFSETAPVLKKILKNHPAYYLHGYPSVIADFAKYCVTDSELLRLLKGNLKGAFLNSEYPYPVYRDEIENVFKIKTQSFYGHTEKCVMAYESDQKFRFVPFQTYGYAEALKNAEGHYDLIGTSYYNLASPLIRYNTKDFIDKPVFRDGVLSEFDIFEGRSGQFVVDRNGRPISLTGLIMGRHHKIFDYCNHIQIGQIENGKAVIFYVPKGGDEIENVELLFDMSHVDICFTFVKLEQPIRTVSGKVCLLVHPNLMKAYFDNR